jgi:hypothetical protein
MNSCFVSFMCLVSYCFSFSFYYCILYMYLFILIWRVYQMSENRRRFTFNVLRFTFVSKVGHLW